MGRRRIGDQNPRGRLERPAGPFLLRADVPEPGQVAFSEALSLVIHDWERQKANGTISNVVDTYATHLRGLNVVLVRHGMPLVCDISPNVLLMWIKMPRPDGAR